MKPDYKLEFDCPVKINEMAKCDGGFSCSQCDKKVFDYSKMSQSDFENEALKNKEVSTCGVYKAKHLDGVYGDWRDGVNRSYRNTIRKSKKKKRFVLAIPFIAGFMLLVGCGSRHVCGDYYDPGASYNDSTKSEVEDVKITNDQE